MRGEADQLLERSGKGGKVVNDWNAGKRSVEVLESIRLSDLSFIV